MSLDDVAIEEELFRVYKRLPYVSEDEFLNEYPKRLGGKKRFKEVKDTIEKIGELTAELVNGRRCVYEITRELRDRDYQVTPDVIFRVLEAYREMGGIRVQMLLPPEEVLEEEIHTTQPQVEVTKEEVPEVAEIPEAAEVPSKAEATEAEAVEEGLAEMLESIEKAPSKTKLSKASEQGAPVLEALLNMNSEIEVASIVTPDGYSVSFASREEIRLDELRVAASSAVIQSVSSKNLGYMQKGEVEQIVLYTENGLIFLLPIGTEWILTVTASEEAQLGTIIRDAKWAGKRARSELKREATSS